MKSNARLRGIALLAGVAGFLAAAQAAPLTTVQNSTVSIPAATLAAPGLPGATNLTGSNFMLSAVMPDTLHGGHAALRSSQEWVRRYNAGAFSSYNSARALAVRADGSILVAGSSSTTATGNDAVLLGYAPDGTPLWTNCYDGPAHASDGAEFLATTPAGEAWVAIQSQRYPTNTQITDSLLIKYAPGGMPLWTNRYTTYETNDVWPTALLVSSSGDAYLRSAVAYWPPTGLGVPVDDVLIRYDSTGNALWTNHYNHSLSSGQAIDPGALALDNDGNLLMAGRSPGVRFPPIGPLLLKCDPDGTPIWTNYVPFGLMDDASLIAVDRQNNILLTGEYWSSNYTRVCVSMKSSPSGAWLWTNVLDGPLYDGGNVPATAFDLAGNAFIVAGRTNTTSPGLYQILKLGSDGTPLWLNQTACLGPGYSPLEGMAVDSAGNLCLAAEALNGSTDDYATAKYSSAGQPLWTNHYDGPVSSDDYPFALAVDSAGSVYVTGQSQRIAGYDIATVKYSDLVYYTPPKDFTGTDTISYVLTDKLGNSATGSVDVVVAPGAFQFSLAPTATRRTTAGFQSQVEGAPAANAVVFEASPDLVNWQAIATNPPAGSIAPLLDSGATNQPLRFYRARQPQ